MEVAVPEVLGYVAEDGLPARTWDVQPWQRRGLLALQRFLVIPAGRRSGKSEFGVMWVLEQYRRARLRDLKGVIWIVYPTYQTASVAWRKFRRLAPKGWIRKYLGTEQHPQALIMAGGISIEFRSGVNPGTLVGEGLLAVWLDESGEIRERVWKESIRPTLMDFKAPALLTGTPKGRNWFFDCYAQGWLPEHPEWAPIGTTDVNGMPSYVNPFIEREEIDTIASDMSIRVYSQEIMAKFLSNEGAVFRLDRVRAKGLNTSAKRTVALGLDIARRQDWTVLTGMDQDLGVTYFERFRDIDWPLQRKRVEAVWEKLERPTIICDATGVGDEFVQELQYMGLPIVPYVFTGLTKRQLVELIAIALDKAESSTLTMPDEPILLNELEVFDMKTLPSGNIRYAAPEGKHDDAVMSYGLALHGALRYGQLGI